MSPRPGGIVSRLNDTVTTLEPNPAFSLDRYYSAAHKLEEKASDYRARGNEEQKLYVTLLRLASLVVETIARHPDFQKTDVKYINLRKMVLSDVLPELEQLQVELELKEMRGELRAGASTGPAAENAPGNSSMEPPSASTQPAQQPEHLQAQRQPQQPHVQPSPFGREVDAGQQRPAGAAGAAGAQCQGPARTISQSGSGASVLGELRGSGRSVLGTASSRPSSGDVGVDAAAAQLQGAGLGDERCRQQEAVGALEPIPEAGKQSDAERGSLSEPEPDTPYSGSPRSTAVDSQAHDNSNVSSASGISTGGPGPQARQDASHVPQGMGPDKQQQQQQQQQASNSLPTPFGGARNLSLPEEAPSPVTPAAGSGEEDYVMTFGHPKDVAAAMAATAHLDMPTDQWQQRDPILSHIASQLSKRREEQAAAAQQPVQKLDTAQAQQEAAQQGQAAANGQGGQQAVPGGPPQQQQEAEGSGGSTLASKRDSSKAFNARPWQIEFDEIEIQSPIGEGSYGKVYLAQWQETPVAVKILFNTSEAEVDIRQALTLSAPTLRQLEEEAGLLAGLRHPHIVQFLAVCTNPGAIVTEFCARGSLTTVLRRAQRSPQHVAQLTWQRRLGMALDACRGMLYLHTRQPPIIHRDLKSPNLLVDASWRVKVTDFNLSKLLAMEPARTSGSLAGLNPKWLAPEVMQEQRSSPASDVFSFGVVLWELLTWRLPWAGANPWQVVCTVIEGGRLQVPPRHQLPGEDPATFPGLDRYIALLERCWAQDELERPTFHEIARELKEMLAELHCAERAATEKAASSRAQPARGSSDRAAGTRAQ